MGSIGPLAVVTPAEFRERTSLALSSRSGSTLLVDQACDNYRAVRSPIAAKVLYDRLRDYRKAHGGEWSRCDRNAVSGGLLEHLYNATAPGALSAEQALALDKKAAARIEEEEIPHARFGVLYFLASIKVEMDTTAMAIECAGAVGAVRGVVNAGGLDHKAAHLALAGTAGLKGVQAGVEKLAQLAAAPSTLEFRDPACVNFVQRQGVQVMQLFPTVPNDGHQVCLLQLLQVLSYGLACHVHVFTQRGQCLAALPMQQVRQTPAARVGKRFENFVDVQQPGPSPMPCTRRSIVDRGQRMNVGAVSAHPGVTGDAGVRTFVP